MPISSRQKHEIKKLGGVRITGLHNGEDILDKKKLTFDLLGTYMLVTLQGVRKVHDGTCNTPPQMMLIIASCGEMILINDPASEKPGVFSRLLRQLAPRGARLGCVPHASLGYLNLDLYEYAQRNHNWDWEQYEPMRFKDDHPVIKVGAIREGLLDEVDPFKPEFDID